MGKIVVLLQGGDPAMSAQALMQLIGRNSHGVLSVKKTAFACHGERIEFLPAVRAAGQQQADKQRAEDG
ncbi:MAG: hypothetical protein ACOX8S_04755 [Christensenellales bacterium]